MSDDFERGKRARLQVEKKSRWHKKRAGGFP